MHLVKPLMFSAQPTLVFIHHWYSYFMRPSWNFQKLPSSWKCYFQVNIWLEKSCRTVGTDQVSLAFGCPFVFAALEKKLQVSIWLTAFCFSGPGCQMFCHRYWMKSCLMLWEASTSSEPGMGLNRFFRIFYQEMGAEWEQFFTYWKLAGFAEESLKELN